MRVIAALLSVAIAVGVNAATVPSHATPNISGTWEGILHVRGGTFQIVTQIYQDSGAWKARSYSINQSSSLDQAPDPLPATVSLTGSTLRYQVAGIDGTYEGMISADGSTIKGAWTPAGGPRLPLDLQRASDAAALPLYETAHSVQFVVVDHGVKLEVLDWGRSGRPVILLAGLGSSARVFDRFAPKLTAWYHVYGITRRGFGGSSAPSGGYSVDRLGKDVLAVMDALKIERPVIIGHSIAGEELSYIGTQDPEKVAGLVYLEAGYGYAFYAARNNLDVPSAPPDINLYIDSDELQRKLAQVLFAGNSQMQTAMIDELLNTDLSLVRKDLQAERRDLQAGGPDLAQLYSTPIDRAIFAGMYRFTKVGTPVLAIYADPQRGPPVPRDTTKDEAYAKDKASVEAQIAALKRYNPSARIVRQPYANHFVFVSNEAEVLKDVHAFIERLPPKWPASKPE